MDTGNRRARANTRGAIVLLVLTLLAAALAWRSRPDPTIAERPVDVDDAIDDEADHDVHASRFDGTSFRVTVHGLDAGARR